MLIEERGFSMPTVSTTNTRPLLVFFGLTFALAWSIWLLLGKLFGTPPTGLVIIGAWAPTVAAVLVTARTEGREGLIRLMRRTLRWRISPLWYFLAIGGTSALALLAIALAIPMQVTVPTLEAVAGRFGLQANQIFPLFLLLPLIFLVTIIAGGPIAEELGWRGYAQERLQATLGPLRAGLLIGAIWALWHLPLFLILPSATGNVPLLYYLPLVTALGGIFGWLYAQTEGSVLISILAHAGVNFTLGALGLVTASPQLLQLFVALVWMVLLSLVIFEKTRQR